MVEQQKLTRLDYLNDFRKIARELREFEAYETIDDLIYRMSHCQQPDRNWETAEDVYRKGIRITFIGDSSASEKRKFITTAFPKAVPLPVENFLGTASGIEYYAYREAPKGFRFIFINTPSLSEWRDVNKITDIGEWHTEAVVFVISGNEISQIEKRCLNKLKYQVDSNSFFFVQTTNDPTLETKARNLSITSDILFDKEKKEENIRSLSSSESSSIAQCFAADSESPAWRELLFQKMQNYMVQYYWQFERKVEGYLRSYTELHKFRNDLNRIADQTTKEVNWINKKFTRKLDQVFPIEASYSYDIRAEIKGIRMRLSKGEIKPKEVPLELDKATEELLKNRTRELEELIAEYFRDISHEVSERIHKFGHTYRSPIPLNRQIELQTISEIISSDLRLDFFRTNRVANVARLLSSGIFPAYFAHSIMTSIATGAAAGATGSAAILPLLSNPATIIAIAVIISLAVIGALWWYNDEERIKQEKSEAVNEGEKDMKLFNYYVAHAIRIEFEEVLHFSENALQNIFKEIRKSERKRVTINNFYPTIKAIHDDSLLKKIRGNRELLESVRL